MSLRIIFVLSILVSGVIANSAYSATICEGAATRIPSYKQGLDTNFANRGTNQIEQQQYNMASGQVTALENAIAAKDQTLCSNTMLVLNQILKMESASQITIGSYELPVEIKPIAEPFDCDIAKGRLNEYSTMAQSFPENKFVIDVISPRIPKLQETITKMTAEIEAAKVPHPQQLKDLETQQAQEKQGLIDSQTAEKKTIQEDFNKKKLEFENIDAGITKLRELNVPVPSADDAKHTATKAEMDALYQRLLALPAKHQSEMDALTTRHAADTAALLKKQADEIQAIKETHRPKCVEDMKPIEDMVTKIANAPKVN